MGSAHTTTVDAVDQTPPPLARANEVRLERSAEHILRSKPREKRRAIRIVALGLRLGEIRPEELGLPGLPSTVEVPGQ